MVAAGNIPLLCFEPSEALALELVKLRPALTAEDAGKFLGLAVVDALARFAAFMRQHGFNETAIKIAEHTHSDLEAFFASTFDGVADAERLVLAKASARELISYLDNRSLFFDGGEVRSQDGVLTILTRKHAVH